MNIAISGSTGMIASYLIPHLKSRGHAVVPLFREDFESQDVTRLREKIAVCDAVVNLAGAKIYRSWSGSNWREIYGSRVDTTRLLVEAINGLTDKPEVFFSASSVACYPSNRIYQEEDVMETSSVGKMCDVWEHEAQEVSPEVRLVIGRFGVVLAPLKEVIDSVISPMGFGIVGTVGEGSIYFSWVHIEDLVRMITLAIESPVMRGVFNFTAPEVTTNREFMHKVARLRHKRYCMQIPPALFRARLGRRSEVLAQGHGAVPARLITLGFKYRYPTVDEAVGALLEEKKKKKKAGA